MRTKMDYSSLGESKSTYSNTPKSTYSQIGREFSGNETHSSIRETQPKAAGIAPKESSGFSSGKLAGALGKLKDSNSNGGLGVAMGLLAGASVGVLAGILMAPDAGRTTRRRLSDSAAWVGRGITESLGNSKSKASSWIGKAQNTIKDATSAEDQAL